MNLLKVLSVALIGAHAVRNRRSQVSSAATTKFIDDVPILNYHLAYEGHSLAQEGTEGLKGQWVVVLKDQVKDVYLNTVCAKLKCQQKGHPNRGGVPFLEFEGTEADLQELVQGGEVPVKFIEPDSKVYAVPEFEAKASASWGLDRIGAPDRTNEGSGVHIYVLDTGVRPTHADFGGRVVPTLDMSSGSPVECSGDTSRCTNDAQGHGTHCAGTTAGAQYGVAPQATVHAVKVLSDAGSGSWSWSYTALDYLATDGERPAVASMSLGGAGTQSAMKTAVDTAVNAGVTVVVAGGNENSNACGFSPAFVPSAITVGSTTSTDARSSFSNYGSCTDIWAPGSDITSASHRSDTGSATFSGTSMACPHVSGAAALLLEKSPSLKSGQVISALLSSAVDGALTGLTRGDVNKLLYVGTGTGGPAPSPPAPPPSSGGCPAGSEGPNANGDCSCPKRTTCYEAGKRKCDSSVGLSATYFYSDCSNCVCKARR